MKLIDLDRTLAILAITIDLLVPENKRQTETVYAAGNGIYFYHFTDGTYEVHYPKNELTFRDGFLLREEMMGFMFSCGDMFFANGRITIMPYKIFYSTPSTRSNEEFRRVVKIIKSVLKIIFSK